jgi:putative transposase
MQAQDFRQTRGEAIAQAQGQIRRIDPHTYKVHSQSGDFEYDVVSGELGWLCSCPDSIYRGVKCKHIWGVEFSLAIRNEVRKSTVVIPEVSSLVCRRCGSEQVVKKAVRHNQSGDIQRYLCRDCGYRFSFNIGFERMHATPQMITSAMQLYFSGESLRNTQKFLRMQGLEVSHVAILKWIRKYIGLMDAHLSKIVPQVSDTWRADELYVKVKGSMKYLFAVMDDETRFWIAQQVSNVKEGAYASRLFMEAKRVADKSPTMLITDALGSYAMAAKLDFPKAEHVREIAFAGKIHNNKMERMNGEVRDREKVMRGLKRADTPILKGAQIYHNYIREHEGLQGKTPAEAAGIEVKGENKWLTLIQNASKARDKA